MGKPIRVDRMDQDDGGICGQVLEHAVFQHPHLNAGAAKALTAMGRGGDKEHFRCSLRSDPCDIHVKILTIRATGPVIQMVFNRKAAVHTGLQKFGAGLRIGGRKKSGYIHVCMLSFISFVRL